MTDYYYNQHDDNDNDDDRYDRYADNRGDRDDNRDRDDNGNDRNDNKGDRDDNRNDRDDRDDKKSDEYFTRNGDDNYGRAQRGTDGDDLLNGGRGDDVLDGGRGFDVLFGNGGDDTLFGGTQNDFVFGGDGDDVLHGASGLQTGRGDLGADRLSGGRGDDVLWVGEGLDALNGGEGHDAFAFKFNDPQTPLAAGTGAAFAAIEDFDASDDTLAFDVPGVGRDAAGANFADGSGGVNGGAATSFYSGAASGSNGERVVVLTDQGFANGGLAVQAAQGEDAGDFVLYFNTTVNTGSLLVVSQPDTAVSIARFTDATTLADFQAIGFTADDFIFV